MLLRFDIWMEGFSVTGGRGAAAYMDTVEASDFPSACQQLADRFEAEGRDFGDYDPEDLSFWGCRLFPSEAEARKTFG